jgi:hypothetical protein
LLSKSIAMTLPIVLLVLDAYPLRRLGVAHRDGTTRRALRAVQEKLPYLVLSALAGAAALVAVSANDALPSFAWDTLPARFALGLYSLAFYVWKTVLPTGLIALHEVPFDAHPLEPRFAAAATVVTDITTVLVARRRQWPGALAVWVAYCVMLAPVSFRLHQTRELVADRHSYLACLGWALLAGAAVGAVANAVITGRLRPVLGRSAMAAAMVWIAGLSVLTNQQIRVWHDTETLWRHALAIDPACAICHNQLGAWLGSRGRVAEAVAHFERGVALRPTHGPLRFNLSTALLTLGQREAAVVHLHHLAERYPADVAVQQRLAEALASGRQ